MENRRTGGYNRSTSWRGVTYDPSDRKPSVSKKVTETYRGISHVETINVEVAK